MTDTARDRLLRLNDLAATTTVQVTAPDLPAEDDDLQPTGVGVENLAADIGGILITRAELDATGLAESDVPNLTIAD